MSKTLERLLELRWDNSIEYLEDDSENAKEYQQLKLKCEQSLKLQELVKKRMDNPGDNDYDLSTGFILQSLVDESEKLLHAKHSQPKVQH